jgi:hypothetical protein
VGGEDHVASAFEHGELGLQRARRLAQVRRGDDVEDDLLRRGDRDVDWPERTDAPTAPEVQGQRSSHERFVGADRGGQESQTRERPHSAEPRGRCERKPVSGTLTAEVAAPDTDRRVVLARLEAQAHALRPLTEGERWTVDALAELRAERYRSRAWRGFLDRSLRRSSEARAARPEMAAQAWRWAAIGGAAWIAAWQLSRRHARVRLNLAAGLAWWAAVWRMLDWHLGMSEGGDGVPRRRLSPADAVTLSRFWLVPLVAGVRDSRRGLPAEISVGGASDWLDGALARRCGRTRLGRDLDSTAGGAPSARMGRTASARRRAIEARRAAASVESSSEALTARIHATGPCNRSG